jgi:hypothetical protein
MAFLPKEALTLTGGCFCGGCRYTISIPAFSDRPIQPTAKPTPISATETVKTRAPVIDIDHCKICRRVSGAIFQVWFICPAEWVQWELKSSASTEGARIFSTTHAVGPESMYDNSDTVLRRFQASDQATRSFCGKCGTDISYFSHNKYGPVAVVDIAVGSMDQESLELVRPDRHGWWDSGTSWIKDLTSRGSTFLIKHPTGDMAQAVD